MPIADIRPRPKLEDAELLHLKSKATSLVVEASMLLLQGNRGSTRESILAEP